MQDGFIGAQGHYWYSKSRRNSLAALCAWAVEEATSAKELAAVARLVAGAGLTDLLGSTIEAKILNRLREARDEKRTRDVLKEARWMGEAFETLRRSPAGL